MDKNEFITNVENIISVDGSENRLDDSAFKNRIIELWEAVDTLEGAVIPYARISQIIFTYVDDNVADTITRMETTVEDIRCCREIDEKLLENYGIDKVIQNLNLANTQKSFLYRSQQTDINQIREKYESIMESLQSQAGQITDEVDQKIGEVKSSSDKLSKELNKAVDSRMNTIYSGFVSVLGIFVSISFTLFGAATLIKNIFEISTPKGFDTGHEVLGANIILAGFSTILIYLLVVGLMQSISTVTNLRYDFSLRRIFIILFISGGIIGIGFIYKNPDISQFKHPIMYMILFVFYVLSGVLLYRYGESVKLVLLRINYKFKIQVTARLDNQSDSKKSTTFECYIRNISMNQSLVQEIWIGNKNEPTKKLISGYHVIRGREVFHLSVREFVDSNGMIPEKYFEDAKRGKIYLYIYTSNRVVKHKVGFSMK